MMALLVEVARGERLRPPSTVPRAAVDRMAELDREIWSRDWPPGSVGQAAQQYVHGCGGGRPKGEAARLVQRHDGASYARYKDFIAATGLDPKMPGLYDAWKRARRSRRKSA
jgi:hypothetical protein